MGNYIHIYSKKLCMKSKFDTLENSESFLLTL